MVILRCSLQMKQTSKDKIINQSLADKLSLARDLRREERYTEAIEAYHRVLFLREDAQFMLELAEIYEKNCDIASAILFYRRANQLATNSTAQQKVKFLSKVQGLQLLALGSTKNILAESEFESFINRYPAFHKRLLKKIEEKRTVADYLESCLAYLEVNQRQFALSEVDNCIMLDQNDADLLVLRVMILWSLLEIPRGYEEFWAAFRLDRTNPEVVAFLQMISPQLEKLYRQAKYHLIEGKEDKCRLKVKRGLQIHPFHTQFLILSAYLHRKRQQYEQALADLQLANKHLEDRTQEEELRSQISLTYNEMGIFLYRQKKYTQALTLFSQGLAFKGGDWGMLTNRGDCHRQTNNFVKALQDYLAAYQIQKKNDELNLRISSIYSIRGVALFNSKNYDLALKQFDESTRYSPKESQFYLSKAKCLLQLNRKPQAVEQLEKCVALNPNNNEAFQMLQQLKDPEERNKVKNGRKVIVLSKEK